MFEGFRRERLDVGGGITINYVVGGNGPPLLLLHGCPENMAMWAGVAPLLTKHYTVICPDLRGYGDSSKPRDLPDHSNYTFRAMAADQVRVMEHLGFKRFHVAGHDRGGRVAHRMTLDWSARVASVTTLDIVPTYVMYTESDLKFGKVFWLWFFLPTPEPLPETMIGADPDFFFDNLLGKYGTTNLDAFDPEVLADYRRCWNDPAMIHAMCSDYRAGISLDLEHDKADLSRKVECPMLAAWAAEGLMGKFYDFPKIWKERATNLRAATVPGGHFFADVYPQETADLLHDFIGPIKL